MPIITIFSAILLLVAMNSCSSTTTQEKTPSYQQESVDVPKRCGTCGFEYTSLPYKHKITGRASCSRECAGYY